MSFITSVTNAFAKDVAYLIERAQTGCKDEKQIIKTALAAGRVFNGIVMAASVIGFVASVLTVNVGGIVSTIALFVAAYESFKFM